MTQHFLMYVYTGEMQRGNLMYNVIEGETSPLERTLACYICMYGHTCEKHVSRHFCLFVRDAVSVSTSSTTQPI